MFCYVFLQFLAPSIFGAYIALHGLAAHRCDYQALRCTRVCASTEALAVHVGSPDVLTIGGRCELEGYAFYWPPYSQNPCVIPPEVTYQK